MKIKFKIAFSTFFFFSFFSNSIFSYDGVMSGAKNLKVLETKYFKIIYPEKCDKTASILYENADKIYEQINEIYEYNFFYKMSIVITDKVESINAYWTSYPYNHIVLYDTAINQSLDVFSEQLLSIFKHELTHAYTFNMKNKFWRDIDKIFGDCVNFSAVWVTGGIAEGATVYTESLSGEGRLNDEFSKHYVKQAKVENDFPNFFDIQGSSNIYPYGIFYMYNGMFTEYLCSKYGTKPYSKFWKRLVNGKTVSVQYAFKKEFGIKLKDAWKDFENSIDVSNVINENDFEDFNIKNEFSKSNFRFSNLKIADDKLFFLDDASSTIYNTPKNDLNKKNCKKLFSKNNIQSFDVSRDGKFLAINYLETNKATIKSRILIYDIKTKKEFYLKDTKLFEPCLIQTENANEYILVASSYENMTYSTSFYKIKYDIKVDGKYDIKHNKQNKLNVMFLTSIKYDNNAHAKNYIDCGNQNMTFIIKQNMTNCIYSVNLHNLHNTNFEITKFSLPDYVSNIKDISFCNDNNLCFTYIENKSMERLGILNLETQNFYLDKNDFSGGIFCPLLLNRNTENLNENVEEKLSENSSEAKKEICYIAKFNKTNKIFTRVLPDFKSTHFVSQSAKSAKIEITNFAPKTILASENDFAQGANEPNTNFASTSSFEESKTNLNAKKYSPVPFYLHGIWFPLSTLSSTTYIPNYSSSYNLPFGITYISANSWTSSLLTLTAGYGIETNSFAFGATLSGGSATSIFSYQVSSATEFDKLGWKLSNAQTQISSYIPFAHHSSFSFYLQSVFQYGRKNEVAEQTSFFPKLASAFSEDTTLYLYNFDYFSASYNLLHTEGTALHSKCGFTLGSYIYYIYNTYNRSEVGFYTTLYFPGFDPNAIFSEKFEYTFPFKLSFYLFSPNYSSLFAYSYALYYPSNLIFSSLPIMSYTFEAVLFSVQIQKALCILPFIFANTFSLYLTSYGILYDPYYNSSSFHITKLNQYFSPYNLEYSFMQNYFVGLRSECIFSPNIGQSTSSGVRFSTYAEVDAQVYASQKQLPFFISVGLSSSW